MFTLYQLFHGIVVSGSQPGSEYDYTSMTAIYQELRLHPETFYFCYFDVPEQ